MPISFQDYLQVAPPSILVIGPPGVGKTTLLSQMPKVYIALCDANPRNPVSFIKRWNADPANAQRKLLDTAQFDIPHLTPKGELIPRSKRYAAWGACMTAAAAAKNEDGSDKFETLGNDSLTTWRDYVEDEIRRQNSKKIRGEGGAEKDDPISQPDYGALYGVAKQAIYNIKALGKRTVWTAHVESRVDKNNDSDVHLKFLSFPGALREQIAGLFDEVWLMSKILINGKPKIILKTISSDFREAGLGLKSGIGIGHEFEVDYSILRAAL